MIKFLILIIVIVLNFFRINFIRKENGKYGFIFISMYLQLIPFLIGKSIYDFSSSDSNQLMIGEFGNTLVLESTILIIILLLLFKFDKFNFNFLWGKYNRIVGLFFLFVVISIINPMNTSRFSSIIVLFSIIQISVLCTFFKSNFSKKEVLLGLYDGLAISTLIQLFLTICYPILGLEQVVTLFKGDNALHWVNRREGYSSATGTFAHPGNLALYSLLTLIFFLSCFFYGYKQKLSKFLILFNLFIIGLTFSRTTYISAFAVIAILFTIFKTKRGLLTVKTITIASVLFLFLLTILYFTPLSDAFLHSDSEEQIDNRFNHWLLGYEIWNSAKYFGIGINSHVYYMSHDFSGGGYLQNLPIFDFLISNPIHNIHVIVLIETGLLGFLFWLYYFLSRIGFYSKHINSNDIISNIFNLTFVGGLISFFVYGFFGWSPFSKEIYSLILVYGYFTVSFNRYNYINRL